jgi:hypothetical protein
MILNFAWLLEQQEFAGQNKYLIIEELFQRIGSYAAQNEKWRIGAAR